MNMVYKSNGTDEHGREVDKNRESGSHHQFTMEKFKDGKRSEKQGKSTEVELFHAKKAVKDLVLKIEQSNAQVSARKLKLQSPGNATHGGGEEEPHYAELMQQLTSLKQELEKLKLDVYSVLESKSKAEKDIELYSGKTSSSLNKVEELTREIEEANEEHVLVELARIEAEKELREIESQRAAEKLEFSKKMELDKKKISEVRREISRGKLIEEKLVATNTDIRALQNEMELLRAMEKNLQKEILEVAETKKRSSEELRVVEEQLSNAKRELESIKDEGFQFMASMDVVREELLLVSRETNRMKKLEKNAESSIERLNSRLMKEKSKLESATSTEERTRGIITNLSTALQKLQAEAETVKEEQEQVRKETSDVKQEVTKTEMDVKSKQKKLQGMISELETVKASEAAALVMLKAMMEKTVKRRAMASQNSAMIWVSNWEYEYLTKTGEAAHAVADKKIAAINGWMEALREQEKEMLLKTEHIEKEIREMIAAEEKKSEVAQKSIEEEGDELADMINAGISTPIKLIGQKSMSGNRRKSKDRRASSMAGSVRLASRSPSITIMKRKRAMPNLGSILRVRSGRNKRNELGIDSYASLLFGPE